MPSTIIAGVEGGQALVIHGGLVVAGRKYAEVGAGLVVRSSKLWLAVGNTQTRYFAFRATADKNVDIAVKTEGAFGVKLYEGVEPSSWGNREQVRNVDRRELHRNDTRGVSVWSDLTVAAANRGEKLWEELVGLSQFVGGDAAMVEWHTWANVAYLIRATNNSGAARGLSIGVEIADER